LRDRKTEFAYDEDWPYPESLEGRENPEPGQRRMPENLIVFCLEDCVRRKKWNVTGCSKLPMMSHFFGPGVKVNQIAWAFFASAGDRKKPVLMCWRRVITDKLTLDARIKAAVLGGRYLAGRNFVLLR